MNRELIYALLRLALSDDDVNLDVYKGYDEDVWDWAFNTLSMHGCSAVVYGGIEKRFPEIKPPTMTLLNFISADSESKRSYARLENLLGKMGKIIEENDVKCLVLKGFSLAAYYPNPQLRKFVDIDLYAPENGKFIDEIFVERGANVNTDFYRHSHMHLRGVLIENHHCLLDVRGRKRLAELDADLKGMAMAHLEVCDGPGLYYPDARFSLIFNLHHAMSHFIYEGISFKFLVDWIFFLRKEKVLLSSEEVALSLRKHGLLKFAAVMSAVSVNHLGLAIDDVPECIRAEMAGLKPSVVEKFVDDLFRPYEPSHRKNRLAERLNNVRRIVKSSWKPKEFLGQSAFGFVWDKFVPILMGRKYEAD